MSRMSSGWLWLSRWNRSSTDQKVGDSIPAWQSIELIPELLSAVFTMCENVRLKALELECV